MKDFGDFLAKRRAYGERILKVAKSFGMEVDFRDIPYLMDIFAAYIDFPNGVSWAQVYERILKQSHEDVSDPRTLNKVKQWTNRYFSKGMDDELIEKVHLHEDKRVVSFVLTQRGKLLMKAFSEIQPH